MCHMYDQGGLMDGDRVNSVIHELNHLSDEQHDTTSMHVHYDQFLLRRIPLAIQTIGFRTTPVISTTIHDLPDLCGLNATL